MLEHKVAHKQNIGPKANDPFCDYTIRPEAPCFRHSGKERGRAVKLSPFGGALDLSHRTQNPGQDLPNTPRRAFWVAWDHPANASVKDKFM